jgi:hypothetical protein
MGMGKNKITMGNARIKTRKKHVIGFVHHEIVYRQIYLSLDPPRSPKSEDMNLWITTCANVCRSVYNYTRTYIIGQFLKKSVYKYARAYDGSFPSLVMIQAIADCTIKLFLSK